MGPKSDKNFPDGSKGVQSFTFLFCLESSQSLNRRKWGAEAQNQQGVRPLQTDCCFYMESKGPSLDCLLAIKSFVKTLKQIKLFDTMIQCRQVSCSVIFYYQTIRNKNFYLCETQQGNMGTFQITYLPSSFSQASYIFSNIPAWKTII